MKLFSIFLYVFILQLPLFARPLRIAVSGSEPFKISKGKETKGISVSIWKEVARDAKLDYKLFPYPTVSESLLAVKSGEVDVAIGPISITSTRSESVSFTQPYYMSGKGILVTARSKSPWDAIGPFLQDTFFYGVGSLLLILFIVGNIIWFAERGVNPKFPKGYIAGVGNGMWFAVVTFTTVGYGDITPITRLGKVITATWMIVALITASSVTAGIATSFTLLQLGKASIDSPEALEGKPVAAIRGTNGIDFAKKYRAKVVPVSDFNQGVTYLHEGKVEALVSDYPIIRHYLNQNPNPKFKVIESLRQRDNYGFATSLKSPLLITLNRSLLNLLEKGKVNKILSEWNLD
ncbi:MAG: transporter substrate-binding domain-containing protein [Spirochaetota bacterium]